MLLPENPAGDYADAQIDDYGKLPRAQFPWRPPLRMEVRARASHPAASLTTSADDMTVLRGTAGFGFWNYPFSVRGDVLMLPEAVWFFYAAPPSDMALVPGVPGWGWKAQVIHSMRPGALLATLPTALATVWGRVSQNSAPAARWLQRLSGAREALIEPDITDWHSYSLEWRAGEARFWVDGNLVLRAPQPPTRPLGFVAWLDNQYAVATPRGVLRFGATPTVAQSLTIDSIHIQPL
ncbi:hypothetical protein [Dictyobacter aurantiacus]|uniref:GH16 domain-containing protein n=1 Tax=Dictyobacter aurantiacus TaxID=1936993 RepID=A0A401ZIL9_9CHLR|nr:hypothetical protein [Dictyobacter aurantiacus]GCE06690.1 hypothetical protein KDAU_40190 [Dictyobacter aurantiacus]